MQVILDDLQVLFDTLKDYSFMSTLMTKLNSKKQLLQKEILTNQDELVNLKNKKLEYVNLYTDGVISKEKLAEFRELTDNKIKASQIKQTQLEEKLKECERENYAVHISKKLKDVLTLRTR